MRDDTRHLGSRGWALGAKTELVAYADGRVALCCPVLADEGLDEPVGRMLGDGTVLVTSVVHSTRVTAYRATLPTPKGARWSPDHERVFSYQPTGRRTDPETGRLCPVWRLR